MISFTRRAIGSLHCPLAAYCRTNINEGVLSTPLTDPRTLPWIGLRISGNRVGVVQPPVPVPYFHPLENLKKVLMWVMLNKML